MREVTLKALAIAVQARVPTLLWGPPGVGKTSAVLQLGRELGLPVEVVIASIREPSDFSGIPVVHDGEVRFAPPEWARRLAQAGKGILFIDEISMAPPAVQAASLRVVLERVVGDLQLPDGVSVVAAANPPEQAAGGWNLAPPLANRFVHLDWTVDIDTWIDGEAQDWPPSAVPRVPDGWEAGIAAQRALVAAFIRARPQLLFAMPKEEAERGRAWPSPRTWDMAARLLAAAQAAQAGQEVEAILLAGCVGEGAALEFLEYKKSLDLPDPEQLLKNPDSFQLPERGDKAYAVLAAVVAAAVRKPLEPARLRAAWRILDRAREQGALDIAAAVAKPLAQASWQAGLNVDEARNFIQLLKAAGLLKE